MDIVNAILTIAMVFGACANIIQILEDKSVQGIHWVQPTISTTACIFSVYFYYQLGQWWSCIAYVVLSLGMLTWLGLMAKYKITEKRCI